MRHIDSWDITLRVAEYEDQTRAEVAVKTDGRTLYGHGLARSMFGETEVPDAGDRLAVGRALLALGNGLVERATAELEDNDLEQKETETAGRV